jgi:AcrR family transcriptional regulator
MSVILDAAMGLVEQNGFDSLNLNAVAACLNVKPPSLYNHVKGIHDLKSELLSVVMKRIGDAVSRSAVGRSEETALREISLAYRRFAKEHPELYRVFVSAPKLNVSGSLEAIAETLQQVLIPFCLEKTDEINFIRLFHAGLHGFVSLENAGFFSADVDVEASFVALVDSQLTILNNPGGSRR